MKNRGSSPADEALREWDFDLPEERIASFPAERREDARLLVVHRDTESLEDARVSDLPRFLKKADLLVFNETRVRQCRVFLRRRTGREIEAVFLENTTDGWRSLVRGAGRIQQGEILLSPDPDVFFQFFKQNAEALLVPVGNDGRRIWDTADESGGSPVQAESFFEKYGHIPLPPYIKRPDTEADKTRYQTTFARRTGSAAAPTAGLHFTPGLFDALDAAGVDRAFLELQIGYGTFAPLTEENFLTGQLHPERFFIPQECAEKIRTHRGRLVAVGTTTLRAMETSYRSRGRIESGEYSTTLFVRPPDRVQSVDGLMTNFHLPKSSLLLLVAAFGGTALVRRAYEHALKSSYRFFSYGDAMLIL